MTMADYLVISPVKNEEKFIEKTIQSVINQTILPKKWIIVDDGSTDRTAEIIRKFTNQHDFIFPLIRQSGEKKRKRGQGVVEAFYEGLGAAVIEDYNYLVKLDGDLILPPDFFEKVFAQFEMDSKLGIASGISYAQKNGKWIREKAAKGYTFGETKVYRRQCFEEIGGLVPHMGWDGIDHIKAVRSGWTAKSIENIIFYHLRPEGRGTGMVKAAWEEGMCCYFMGYHPVFFFLRALKNMTKFPFFIYGGAMLYSHFRCALLKEERIADKGFIAFLRRNQLKRLLSLNSKYTP